MLGLFIILKSRQSIRKSKVISHSIQCTIRLQRQHNIVIYLCVKYGFDRVVGAAGLNTKRK